jgi:hypothetical protein
MTALGKPGLRWLKPSLTGRDLTPEELQAEDLSVGNRKAVKAWASKDDRTRRMELEGGLVIEVEVGE